jgi:hypothetical protein
VVSFWISRGGSRSLVPVLGFLQAQKGSRTQCITGLILGAENPTNYWITVAVSPPFHGKGFYKEMYPLREHYRRKKI